ncbi:MAG: DUF3299 domain-containing protein [Gemmatimonadota bacterium]
MAKDITIAVRAGLGALGLLVFTAWPTASVQASATPECTDLDFSMFVADSDDPVEVTWRVLAGLDYQTGELSERLNEVAGKAVRIPGFTVPLEDFASSATEFLLVPYVGACVHTPPPPPNQLVWVEMDGRKRAKMDGWNPVWLEGVLHVEDVESIYGSSAFRVVGTSVTPYQ